MKIIGHRGALNESLENTISSFVKAIDYGCDIIEIDALLSKDKKVVIHHDQSLKRTANLDKKISDLTSLEIKEIKLINGEKIPTLEESCLTILPKAMVNIELKSTEPKLIEEIFAVLSTKDHPRIIISCFDLEPLLTIKDKYPRVQLAILWGKDNEQQLNPVDFLKKNPNFYFHPQADLVNYQIIYQVKKTGCTIFPWVPAQGVEDPANHMLWSTLKALQVDGLCTNYPKEFSIWLKQA